MKILIADDHPLLREALLPVLRELAGEVTPIEAADGEAVRRVVAEHPDLDLVLLDLCLPGVRGLELFEELRRVYPALPLVVLSALDDLGTVKAVLGGGALGFIPKSSSHQVMVNALRLVLAGGRYLPPELMPYLAGDDWASRPARATSPGVPAGVSADTLGLTGRQKEVLARLAQGQSNKQICRSLGLAEATVKVHVTAVLRALKVTSRAQAIVAINRLGLRIEGPGGAGGELQHKP
ncbi:response regulator [Thiocapsa sp.]|uniref:response regulator n=1 Tax=Thiocapsa sp. TaxID=2024551 RepID=UPI003593E557